MWLGIDLGSSSIKCLVLDEGGAAVASSRSAYAVDHPTRDAAEIDPDRWWAALVLAAAALPAATRAALRGIGLSGQMHGVVLIDAAGRPCAPAQLWMDRRAVAELARYPDPQRAPCGNRTSPGMAGPLLLRLVGAGLDKGAAHALQPKDWLGWRLTGENATDPSDASATLLAGAEGSWDFALIERLGLPKAWFAPIRPSQALRGRLRADVAAELGLPPGIPVAIGAADTAAALLGNGVVAAGDAQLTLGTGAQLVVVGDPGLSSNLNRYRSAVPQPAWYAMAAMLNGGLALDWAAALLGLDRAAALAALDHPPSPADPVFLPYLAGERVPYHDPALRGAWLGLGTADSRDSLMRAAYLGVGCAIRAGLDSLRAAGLAPASIQLVGGGTTDTRWQRLLADILGVPLLPSAVADASARGAALLGGIGGGGWAPDRLPPPPPAAEPVVPRHAPQAEAWVERFQAQLARQR
jgi:xylulokinase